MTLRVYTIQTKVNELSLPGGFGTRGKSSGCTSAQVWGVEEALQHRDHTA